MSEWRKCSEQFVDLPFGWHNSDKCPRLVAYLEILPEIADKLGYELQEKYICPYNYAYRLAPKHKVIHKVKEAMKDD